MKDIYRNAEEMMETFRGFTRNKEPDGTIHMIMPVGFMNKCADDIEQMLQETAKPEYQRGYEYGYKTAIKDVVNKMKEMEWYGGDQQEKRAAGVPEHHAAGAGADE